MDREDKLDIPESLIKELKAQDRPLPLITNRVDRALAKKAGSQFSTRRPPAWRSRPAWYAAAAAAAVALFVFQPQRSVFETQAVSERSAIYADVDGSGRVDIADVLSLAHQGGRASQAELDAFAMLIVSLNTPGDSS